MISFVPWLCLLCLFGFGECQRNISTKVPDYQKVHKVLDGLRHGLLERAAEYYEKRMGNGRGVTECAEDILSWKKALLGAKDWALTMSDANGKYPHGILKGNIFALGQFDECLSIDSGRIKGKYCPIKIGVVNISIVIGDFIYDYLFPESSIHGPSQAGFDRLKSLYISYGACVPHSCSAAEVGQVFDEILTRINVTRTLIEADDSVCSVNEPKEWTALEISGLVVFSSFAAIIINSTIYDIVERFVYKRDFNDRNLLIAFSAYTNTEKLFKINKASNSLRCLHGIRVLSMFWIILCHRYQVFALLMPVQNLIDVLQWSETYSAMPIIAGSVSVDTFFLMSGLLLAYLFCKQCENRTPFNLPLFYLHRFVRLWPAMAALVFFVVALLPRLIEAPLWPVLVKAEKEICEAQWWTTLLYVQNYVKPATTCIPHTWYLAADTQLYIFSPILLLPILKSNKIVALSNILFWVVISQATIITMVYLHNWGAVLPVDDGTYWDEYYVTTHIRGSVWILGFLGGYILYQTKDRDIKIHKVTVALLWAITIAIIWSVTFGAKWMSMSTHKITHLQDGTYNAFARSAWALAVFWVIFACLNGLGGPVNWFLSLRIWEVLGRLSYSMYLLHVYVQLVQRGNARVVPHFEHFIVVYDFFGDVICTIVISYLWVIAFESPFLVLERILLPTRKT